MKTCKVCGLEKLYDRAQKKNSKASGFYGSVCWTCFVTAHAKVQSAPDGLVKARMAKARIRATPEGRAKDNAASALWHKKTRSTPEGKAKANEASLAWAKKYPEKQNALNMKRHAAKLRRTPPWADLTAIAWFYKEAQRLTKLTGIKYVVDHIVPLRGKKVSGLHVETNLQVITKAENSRKGNRYE